MGCYHFFVHVLECLRRLLKVNWKTLTYEWEQGSTHISLSLLADLLCNLYNTNSPEGLPIYHEVQRVDKAEQSSEGRATVDDKVDLDILLALLIEDFRAGMCPVHPLINPRSGKVSVVPLDWELSCTCRLCYVG